MIKLIKWLLGACDHRWKTFHHCNIVNTCGTKVGDEYHLHCEKCGNLKRKRF